VKAFVSLALVVCIIASSPGCATIATGGGEDQAVRFSSTPKGADVFVNDERVGKTPMTMRLPRKDDHHVRIEKVGYQPYEKDLRSGMNAWMFGNILLGGLIGLGVDLLSGASSGLDRTNVSPTLVKAMDGTTPSPAPSNTGPVYSSGAPYPSAAPARTATAANPVSKAKPSDSAKAK
jgi:hypothetical protein